MSASNLSTLATTTIAPKPTRPKVMPVHVGDLPYELTAGARFVMWDWVWNPGSAKWTKPPYSALTNSKTDATNPTNGVPLDIAITAAARYGRAGVGRMLFEADGFVAWDFDDCYDAATNTITSPRVQAIVTELDSYCEITPSRTGLRVWVKASIAKAHKRAGAEVYGSARFMTLTGAHLAGTPKAVHARQEQTDRLIAEIFPEKTKPVRTAQPEQHTHNADEATILSRAETSANFRSWWNPTEGEDSSAIDLSFCNALVSAGATRAQVDSIFRSSPRMRDKWSRNDYRTWTLDKACDGTIQSRYDTPHAKIANLPANTIAAELARVTAERDEARRTISGMVQICLSPHMTASEKIALIASVNAAEHKRQRGEVRSDGSVELTAAEISDDWRPAPATGETLQPTNANGSVPRMKRGSVKPVLAALVERGLLPATPRDTTKARANGAAYHDTAWDVLLPAQTSDLLAIAAAWKPDEPKIRQPRSRDRACPHCGEVHAILRTDTCTGCGTIRSTTEIQPDFADFPMSPKLGSMSTPAPYVAKKRQQVVNSVVSSMSPKLGDIGTSLQHSPQTSGIHHRRNLDAMEARLIHGHRVEAAAHSVVAVLNLDIERSKRTNGDRYDG